MDFNYPAKFEPLIKLLKSNQGSTGALFWPVHSTWICVAAHASIDDFLRLDSV